MPDELELLRKARAFDKEALALLHDRYYPSIYRYLSFRIADPQTAEDMTSEVFIRFLSAIKDRNAPPNTIRGWLFGAARNVLKEQYRKQRQMNEVELDERVVAGGQSPDQKVVERAEKEALREALADLTPEQQHVLALRFGYGMPIKDVAETVNKSEGSVKMLQARAIAALAKRLAGHEADGR
ncbi:MAG: sigma-70 family RNA polymerase sigma factor [Anaerolineae bacterium]|nr:sigma-70 family RNA polymerase sigma factor [Anaerolineae bacterium]RIK19970.1 MAG: RNA polymerase subunit sigma-70 [Anaerolineae bacterium]